MEARPVKDLANSCTEGMKPPNYSALMEQTIFLHVRREVLGVRRYTMMLPDHPEIQI